MKLADIQRAIEAVASAAGFACDPGVLTLTVPIESLPGAGIYFSGFTDDPRETQTATLTARFRVDLLFALTDPAKFRADMLTKIPALHEGIRADRSLGGLVDVATVVDGGPPQAAEAAVPVAVKSVWIDAEYEEDA